MGRFLLDKDPNADLNKLFDLGKLSPSQIDQLHLHINKLFGTNYTTFADFSKDFHTYIKSGDGLKDLPDFSRQIYKQGLEKLVQRLHDMAKKLRDVALAEDLEINRKARLEQLKRLLKQWEASDWFKKLRKIEGAID